MAARMIARMAGPRFGPIVGHAVVEGGAWAAAALACAALHAADPALRWRWSNPAPHGNHIFDMASASGLVVAACERGQLYSSLDLDGWDRADTGTDRALRAVGFFGSRLVVVGEAGTVLYADPTGPVRAVDLGTGDWLEGLAVAPGLCVAVGDNGAVYTSADAAAWRRQPQPFTTWLRGVAFGQNTFVAVGESGFVATSADGTNWTVEPRPVKSALNRVAWASNTFVAVGDLGVVLASPNGKTWTRQNAGATNHLYAVAAANGSWVVAGSSEVRLRNAAGAWSNELDPRRPFPAPSWTYYSALWDGGAFQLGGRSGVQVEGFQTNGTSFIWSARTSSTRNWLWDVKRLPDFYVAVGDRAGILTSPDGRQWDIELTPAPATNAIFLGVGGTTNLLVAVGTQGAVVVSTNTIELVPAQTVTNGVTNTVLSPVSSLGIAWTAVQPRPTTVDLQAVTALGDLLVVAGAQGTVLTSRDGLAWSTHRAPTTAFLSSLEAFPGGLVAVGDQGTILTSPDGSTWTPRRSGTTNWIYRVRYLGNRLVAVGQNGALFTSPDAIAWTPQASSTNVWLNDVAWAAGRYFVVGSQGAVLTSADAQRWTPVQGITHQSLYAAATANGQLVAVGLEGAILRTRTAPFAAPVAFLDFSRASGRNAFLFAGQPDQRFALERSVDLQSWQTEPPLEVTQPSGTLLYLAPTNTAHIEFYRTVSEP
jgi:hypothetical protein